jgi:predicted acyltransferase
MNPIHLSVSAAQESGAPLPPKPPERLASLDAYRGLAMVLMASGMLGLPNLAEHFPDQPFWQWVGFHWEHVPWAGCSLHDLIQPSFTFMVGVALPFSLAGRMAQSQSPAALWRHVLWRSLVLVLLGVALRSVNKPITNWTFEDTLTQIGLGYPLLYAISGWGRRAPWVALAVILAGYWAAFAAWPLPPADFPWEEYHGKAWFSGFQAHWNQNSNVAWAFDRWFMNLFPRMAPFTGNGGGYSTLSFIPTLGTMVLGLVAGRWLKSDPPPGEEEFYEASPWRTIGLLVLAGTLSLAAGWGLDRLGWCPSVKRIWTPSWTLFSGGCCFLAMAGFYMVADVWGAKRLFFPLIVVGMNSIAAYVMAERLDGFIGAVLHTHLGSKPFQIFGEIYGGVMHGGAVLLVLWLILYWMHRRKLYLKV